jgi:outer membrane receptor protein involved in Fe transport
MESGRGDREKGIGRRPGKLAGRLTHVWVACLTAVFLGVAHGQEAVSEPVLVEASRLPNAESGAPFSIDVVSQEELRRAPQLRLDDILRAQVPGFSLFRRNSSRTANPTTQGVTLRNFGPSGAGRTLVLLDGIPLNDPFAGYVLWSQVPPAAVESVLVNLGGGAGLFGNAALAGTIFLLSEPMETNAGFAEGSIGNAGTYEASVGGTVAHRPFAAAIFAERFSTGGYPVIAPEQRGRVDNNASADSDLFDLRAEWQIDPNASLSLRARHFDDERGNGTVFTHNETTGDDISAVFTRRFPAQHGELRVGLYGQERSFSSTFSSINATRDVETPALDQFDVPAQAAGGSLVWSMSAGSGHQFTLGADARWVEGETNELFFWNGTQFTRLRRAGGEQFFAGLFAEDTWSVCPTVTIVGGFRVDHWELSDGFRRESVRATGQLLTDSAFNDRAAEEINGRIGARVKATDTLALRGAFYTGFRVPTLNELYRPFRVGNDVTNPNPELDPEHLLGGEIAAEWQATPTFRLTGTGFLNRLEDAVGNVTLSTGPGGTMRQRQNIDLVSAPGFEAMAEWQVVSSVKLRGAYLFTHPTIERAADPLLEGKLLAQTPENVFTAGLEWTPTAKWVVTTQLRYCDRQFEDDQNSRVLASFTTFDAAVLYQFSEQGAASIRVENLFDSQIETGKSADGIISIGAPRVVSLQVRWQL